MKGGVIGTVGLEEMGVLFLLQQDVLANHWAGGDDKVMG